MLEVGVGDAGCLGVLPLRLLGVDEDGAIGGNRRCRCVFLVVWAKARKKCRCHCRICTW